MNPKHLATVVFNLNKHLIKHYVNILRKFFFSTKYNYLVILCKKNNGTPLPIHHNL